MQEQQGNNNNKAMLCFWYKIFGLKFAIYVFWNWIVAL